MTTNNAMYSANQIHTLANGIKHLRPQAQGSLVEQLVEGAGRTCYNSWEIGRPSKEYHRHILSQKHTSVLAHAMGRFPGLGHENLRTMVETGKFLPEEPYFQHLDTSKMTAISGTFGNVACLSEPHQESEFFRPFIDSIDYYHFYSATFVTDRYVSHEFIRHSKDAAISQLSSHYKETVIPFPHPWLENIRTKNRLTTKNKKLNQSVNRHIDFPVNGTIITYTANVAQWKRIFLQRLQLDADPGINRLCRNLLMYFKEVNPPYLGVVNLSNFSGWDLDYDGESRKYFLPFVKATPAWF